MRLTIDNGECGNRPRDISIIPKTRIGQTIKWRYRIRRSFGRPAISFNFIIRRPTRTEWDPDENRSDWISLKLLLSDRVHNVIYKRNTTTHEYLRNDLLLRSTLVCHRKWKLGFRNTAYNKSSDFSFYHTERPHNYCT